MVNKNDLNVCTLTKCVQTIKILLIFHQILTKLQVNCVIFFRTLLWLVYASNSHSIVTIYTNVYVGRSYSIRTSYPTSSTISLPEFVWLWKT